MKILRAIAFGVFAVFLLPSSLTQADVVGAQKSPQVPGEQRPANPPKPETNGGEAQNPKSVPSPSLAHTDSDKKTSVSGGDRDEAADEASEFWTIFGHHIKITDFWLVVFTCLLFVATLLLWIATRSLVVDARETSRKQLRAYLSLKPSNMVFIGDVPLEIDLIIKNHGQTPASRVVFQNAVHFPEYPLPQGYDPGNPADGGDSTEGVWPDEKSSVKRELGRAIAPEILRGLKAGNRRVVAFGFVRYNDIFGEPHFTKLCASFDWRQMATAKRKQDPATGHNTFDFEWQYETQHNDFD
jgi:hypothetical protein